MLVVFLPVIKMLSTGDLGLSVGYVTDDEKTESAVWNVEIFGVHFW